MKNISTGTGLCVLGLCLAGYPVIDRMMPRADASVPHASAIAAAAVAQAAPTIVWYGVCPPQTNGGGTYKGGIFRAWSDGKIECKQYWMAWQGGCGMDTSCDWQVFSSANQGYSAASDINFDGKVDGNDLGQLLAAWGDAPRHDIPPSDCPLNLVTP